MTPEFTHCALHARDLDESIAFYESYCGLRIVKEHGKDRERTVWMAHGDGAAFVLVLLGGGSERAPDKNDMTHYGFAVASRADVDTIAERISLLGGVATLKGTDGGKPYSVRLRFMDVWQKRGGRWQVVFTQATRAPAN